MAISRISFVGGGRISWLLLKRLENKNVLPQTIIVTDTQVSTLEKVKSIAPQRISGSTNNLDAVDADVVFLAVHPPVLKSVLPELTGKIPERSIVVSLVPVIKMNHLAEALGCVQIVRMIPNASSLLGAGYNPVVFSDNLRRCKGQLAGFFWALGHCVPEVAESWTSIRVLSAYGTVYVINDTTRKPEGPSVLKELLEIARDDSNT